MLFLVQLPSINVSIKHQQTKQVTYIFHYLSENSWRPVVDIPTVNEAYEYLKSYIHPQKFVELSFFLNTNPFSSYSSSYLMQFIPKHLAFLNPVCADHLETRIQGNYMQRIRRGKKWKLESEDFRWKWKWPWYFLLTALLARWRANVRGWASVQRRRREPDET